MFFYKEMNKKNYTIYGLWVSTKSENFDEYLKAIGNNSFLWLKLFLSVSNIGLPFIKRSFAILATHSIYISKKDKNWYINGKINLPFGVVISGEINCTEGVEFDNSLLKRVFKTQDF